MRSVSDHLCVPWQEGLLLGTARVDTTLKMGDHHSAEQSVRHLTMCM